MTIRTVSSESPESCVRERVQLHELEDLLPSVQSQAVTAATASVWILTDRWRRGKWQLPERASERDKHDFINQEITHNHQQPFASSCYLIIMPSSSSNWSLHGGCGLPCSFICAELPIYCSVPAALSHLSGSSLTVWPDKHEEAAAAAPVSWAAAAISGCPLVVWSEHHQLKHIHVYTHIWASQWRGAAWDDKQQENLPWNFVFLNTSSWNSPSQFISCSYI